MLVFTNVIWCIFSKVTQFALNICLHFASDEKICLLGIWKFSLLAFPFKSPLGLHSKQFDNDTTYYYPLYCTLTAVYYSL